MAKQDFQDGNFGNLAQGREPLGRCLSIFDFAAPAAAAAATATAAAVPAATYLFV